MPNPFTYTSVYYISLHADFESCIKNPGLYHFRDSSERDTEHTSEEEYTVTFERNYKSLRDKTIPLIRINYNLSTDQPSYNRLISILKTKLNKITFPAKIYIAAYANRTSTFISQHFLQENGSRCKTKISYQELARIFNCTLGNYKDKAITFHFAVCYPDTFVPRFIQQLGNLGFTRPIAISYKNKFRELVKLPEVTSGNFTIQEMSTSDRYVDGTGTAHHLSNDPNAVDNKFVTYLARNEVRQTDYRVMKERMTQEYGVNSRNNFCLNYEAIAVVGLFMALQTHIENELVQLNQVFFIRRDTKKIRIYNDLLSQIRAFNKSQITNTCEYANILSKWILEL